MSGGAALAAPRGPSLAWFRSPWVYLSVAAVGQPDSARPVMERDSPLVGRVIETLPSALYRVELDDGRRVLAHTAGKARLQAVRILPGDRVQIEISATDPGRGRILQRLQ